MKKEFRNFEDARKWIHSQNLKGQKGWTTFCKSGKKPEDIPYHPERQYKNKGWVNYGDWLGTNFIHPRKREYWKFSEARDYVHKLGLKNSKVWRQYTKSGKLPKEIPADPYNVYKNKGWVNTGDWLGTGSVASFLKEYWPFAEARDYVHKLKLKSQLEWTQYTKSGKLPKEIPSTPQGHYKNKGWKGIGDWLGTGRVATQSREYLSFTEAKTHVHKLKLKSQGQWRTFTKSKNKPKDIPANPEKVYKNKGWKGIGDWLGTGRLSERERSKNFLSYSDARKTVHQLAKTHNIRTNKDWDDAVKKGLIPDNIPKAPWYVYSKKRKK